MKIFHSIEKPLSYLGICRPLQNQKNPFNWKVFSAGFTLWLISLSTTIFFFFEAKTFREYAYSSYSSVTSIAVAFNFTIFALKSPKMFELMDNFERTIEQSKLAKFIYFSYVLFSFVVIFAFACHSGHNEFTDKYIFISSGKKHAPINEL